MPTTIKRVGRPVSAKYYRRVRAIRPVTAQLRVASAEVLEDGLREATQIELYNRTPLKVTYAMMESIGSRIRGQIVEVGYGIGAGRGKAPYAQIRVNMTGISVLGGHILDMHPSIIIHRVCDHKLRALNKRAQKGILNGVV